MVAATQCFDQNLMDTLVRDNINPIERAETAELLVASALFRRTDAVQTLVQESAKERVGKQFDQWQKKNQQKEDEEAK